jgi:hypothetical protein|tara:strand:- start:2236 stop:3285 length:1050 start_codon:yes stop_codon:yes gene_type:complete
LEQKVRFTKYFKDFLQYAAQAKKVQHACNLGGAPYLGSCGDDLIENVTIYDTVERKHAGFQNMLQDLWFADKAPKHYKWPSEHQARNRGYRHLRDSWSRREWLFVFLTHRITGSGASFEVDHGYRNTIITELAKLKSAPEMVDWIKNYSGVMYTSIGNQIPAFPKPRDSYKTGGKVYFGEYALQLVDDVWDFVDKINGTGRKALIREIVDFMCAWNRDRGMKAFHFQYTATVADLADYYMAEVEESSHMYYGKNAQEAMDLFANKIGRVPKAQFYDLVMEAAQVNTGGYPKDLEDVMCDYIRYVENYIPDNREKTYEHLDRTKVWNSSIILDHPKGRQKWMLGTQDWIW